MLDKLTIPNLKIRYGEKVPPNIKKQELIDLIIKKEKLEIFKIRKSLSSKIDSSLFLIGGKLILFDPDFNFEFFENDSTEKTILKVFLLLLSCV